MIINNCHKGPTGSYKAGQKLNFFTPCEVGVFITQIYSPIASGADSPPDVDISSTYPINSCR
jgi:hypothetical protein